MNYPPDFVKAVKEEFPDWKRIHRDLDDGNTVVGRALRDTSYPVSLTGKEVLERWKSGLSIAKVEEEMAHLDAQNTRRKSLYDWWCRIEEGHFPITIRVIVP